MNGGGGIERDKKGQAFSEEQRRVIFEPTCQRCHCVLSHHAVCTALLFLTLVFAFSSFNRPHRYPSLSLVQPYLFDISHEYMDTKRLIETNTLYLSPNPNSWPFSVRSFLPSLRFCTSSCSLTLQKNYFPLRVPPLI